MKRFKSERTAPSAPGYCAELIVARGDLGPARDSLVGIRLRFRLLKRLR